MLIIGMIRKLCFKVLFITYLECVLSPSFPQGQEEDFAKARKELNELRDEESKLEHQAWSSLILFYSNPSIIQAVNHLAFKQIGGTM